MTSGRAHATQSWLAGAPAWRRWMAAQAVCVDSGAVMSETVSTSREFGSPPRPSAPSLLALRLWLRMSAALARCFPQQRICVGTVGVVRDVIQRRWRGSGGGGHDAPRPEAVSLQRPPCLCLVFLRLFNSCRCRVCCCYELPCLFDSCLCRVCCCYRCTSDGVSMLLHMLGLASAGGADLFLRWVTEMCTGSVLPRAGPGGRRHL